MQCGVQLTAWFSSANVMFNSSGCNISKLLSRLGLVNCLIFYYEYVILCNVVLSYNLVHLLWCLVNCFVQSAMRYSIVVGAFCYCIPCEE